MIQPQTNRQENDQSLRRSALEYARNGWSVFPLWPRAKNPLTRHGVKDASQDQELINQWWRRWPTANVGLAIPPGLLVVDVDSPEALQRLKVQDRILPTTATASTGRGRHFWYSTAEAKTRNCVGLFPGIDVRAVGGYVVAPPSVHPSGSVYRWDIALSNSNISECPEWLSQLLSCRSRSPQGRSAECWHETILARIPEGRRNQTLTQVAGLLFRRLPATVAAELAYCWAQAKLAPPLPEREVLRTIDSIAGRELRRRGEAR